MEDLYWRAVIKCDQLWEWTGLYNFICEVTVVPLASGFWDVTWSSLDTFKLKLSKCIHTKNKKKLHLGFPWSVPPRIKPCTEFDQSTYGRQTVKPKRRVSKRLPMTPFVEIPRGWDFLRLSFTKAIGTSHSRHRWIIEEEAFWEWQDPSHRSGAGEDESYVRFDLNHSNATLFPTFLATSKKYSNLKFVIIISNWLFTFYFYFYFLFIFVGILYLVSKSGFHSLGFL